jgi:GT2 family glycosyltransferase
MPKISIITLTYNSAAHINTFLQSIERLFGGGIKSGDIEIVVVDNASQDRTLDEIKKAGVKVKTIENRVNMGFSRGINVGAKNAKGDYILIINPDAVFKSGDILNTIKLFKNDRNLGVIGGKILNKNGHSEKSAGKFLKTFEIALMSLGIDEALGIRSSPDSFKEVDFVSGGFMIVNRNLFNSLGGFDEYLFMYIEDMEFCYRIRKRGLKVVFDPEIVIIHESHGSSNRAFAVKNILKGLLYFQKKHGSKTSYLLTKSLLTVKSRSLQLIGIIINNRYLKDAYSGAL